MAEPMVDDPAAPTGTNGNGLLPCPFCGSAVQPRDALWPSEGDSDAVIHAAPTDCPLVTFSNGTSDKSAYALWNQRFSRAPSDVDWNAESRRLSSGLLAIHAAPASATTAALKSVAYDIALNCIDAETSAFQIERRSAQTPVFDYRCDCCDNGLNTEWDFCPRCGKILREEPSGLCLAGLAANKVCRPDDYSRPGLFATHNCWKCKDGTDPSRCPTPDRPGNCGYPHARND